MARSDDAQQDLDELGALLRGYRTLAKVTGAAAARRAGFTQSKLSKIENGVLLPSLDDVQQLIAGLGTDPSSAEQALRLIRGLHDDPYTHRMVLRRGVVTEHAALLSRFGACGRVVVAEIAVVPDWLRTRDYLLAATKPLIDRGGRATSLLRKRKELLSNPDIKFEFLVRETAVRTRVGSLKIMAEQLHDMASAPERFPNVTVRVVTSDAVVTPLPTHGFELHDDRHVVVTTLPGVAVITSDVDIQPFRQMIESLRASALTERQSHSFLRRLAESFERLAAR
ncbi:Helix-turn-helix domain-containing protein [Lentzea albidocapillata subsp. violacea]|uniref:Helix-turn-helix domain-containing protein n=1 Tax=Lentzea albidocapillata subsp. violacea TaxID=128104 RepID=A0A1G9RUR1_9PSEU|nr:Scr1 family TA system antitoxin-like transcriptional regulator [Lentzea albidocapillata]SDM26976.1 Helix-turn-helix domain-containing protein [Lentzea albidocapillata subsp. violacea]